MVPILRLGAVVAVSVALAAQAACGSSGSNRALAPAFALPDARGPATVSLVERGDRPAVVNFLASWCGPCRDELPVLAAADRRLGGAVAFYGVDTKDSATAGPDLLAATGVGFPVGADPDGAVAERYRVRNMPTTVFVAADGRVRATIRGRVTPDALQHQLDDLMAGRS